MIYLLQVIAAALLTAVLMPFFMKLGLRWGMVDMPGGRRIHDDPTPRTGGIAMGLGLLGSLVLAPALGPLTKGILPGLVVLFAVGIVDDRYGLDYRIKFGAQLVAVSTALWGTDLELRSLGLIAPGYELPLGILGGPTTALFLLAVINSVNLADGLDSLAGGLCLLSFCATAVLPTKAPDPALISLASCAAGTVIGFLRYNTHPAMVFMGDTGSQILGFMLGITLLTYHQSASQPQIGIVLFIAGIPILDMLTVIIQRIREGQCPFRADRNHLHHILLQKGLRPHQAVVAIYFGQLVLIGVGLSLLTLPSYVSFWIYSGTTFLFVFFMTAFKKLPLEGLLKFFNRTIFGPLREKFGGGIRIIVARTALGGIFLSFGTFLILAPVWVRPIPREIGAVALVFFLVCLVLWMSGAQALQPFLKVPLYFCSLYSIVAMEIASEQLFCSHQEVWVYHLIFAFMAVCYCIYLLSGAQRSRLSAIEYLLAAIVMLILLAPNRFIVAYNVTTISSKAFLIFLCVEVLWQSVRRKRGLFPLMALGTLGFTAIMSFFPWFF